MGYTTEFKGKLKFNKKLDPTVASEIIKLKKYNPYEGEKDMNKPESYCQWILAEDQQYLEWDQQEKFYYYIEWLKYIIEQIVKPNGYRLNGTLLAEGEDIENDVSQIIVKDNKITHKIFTSEEIKSHLDKKTKAYSKKAGEVIMQTKVDNIYLHSWTFYSLKDFFGGHFKKTELPYYFALIKEQDGQVNWYQIHKEFVINNKIPHSTLGQMHQHSDYLSAENIKEIVHFNSPLFSKILRSKNVYCIVYNKPYLKKRLVLFKDNKFIKRSIELIKTSNPSAIVRKSNDLSLIYFLSKRIIGAIGLAYLTFFAVLFIAAPIQVMIQKGDFSLLLTTMSILTALIYYYLVVKYLFLLFWYYFPITLFKTKSMPNKVG